MSNPSLARGGNLEVEKNTENPEYQTDSSNTGVDVVVDAEKATEAKPWGHDAPDGGAVAWLVVFGAWCTSFCSFGWLNSMGLLPVTVARGLQLADNTKP